MIPGSYNIPFKALKRGFSLPAKDFKATFGFEKPSEHANNLVIYGQNLEVARQAVLQLKDLGFYNMKLYQAGFRNWVTNRGKVVFPPKVDVNLVTYDDLIPILKDTSVTVIDVRPPEFREEDGWIPETHNIPISELETAMYLTEAQFTKRYGFEKPSFPSANIVVYCSGGIQSRQAALLLKNMGYSNVQSYDGSFDDYITKGGRFVKPVRSVSVPDIRVALKTGSIILIDLRPTESLVKDGHIPGSYSMPHEYIRHIFEMPNEDFKATFGFSKPPLTAENIILIGKDMTMAYEAAIDVQVVGYHDVMAYPDGFSSWVEAGGEVVPFSVPGEIFPMDEIKSSPGVLMIDVRPKIFVVEYGWVENSHRIPLPELIEAFNLPHEDFLEKYGFERPPVESQNVVMYSDIDVQTNKAVETMQRLGYANVRKVTGTIADWASVGVEVLNFNPEPEPLPVEVIISGNEPEDDALKQSEQRNTIHLLLIGFDGVSSFVEYGGGVILDVRPPSKKYLEGQIYGSHNIPYKAIERGFTYPNKEFEATFGFPKPDLEDIIVVYSSDVAVTLSAVTDLRTIGYNNIRLYARGYPDWLENGGATEKPVKQEVRVATFSEVKQALSSGEATVIDVRPLEHRKKEGWIRGSHSLPLSKIKSAMFLPDQIFEQRYNFKRPLFPNEKIIVYCYGGIQARQATLTFKNLGYKNVKSYDSSLMNWIENKGSLQIYIPDVPFEELAEGVENESLFLIDVSDSYIKFNEGVIPTSVNIPAYDIDFVLNLPEDEFFTLLGASKPERNAENIVIYGPSPDDATAVAELFTLKHHFPNTRTFLGGLPEWRRQGGPVEVHVKVPVKDIDFDSLQDKVFDGAVMIDTRVEADRKSSGWIANSFSIPLSELEEAMALDDETFKEIYEFDRPQLDATNLVVYGSQNIDTQKSGEIMELLGYKDVRIYRGGYQDWYKRGGFVLRDQLEISDLLRSPPNINMETEQFIEAKELEILIADESVDPVVIDVRKYNRKFAGGIIPGSINIPLAIISRVFMMPQEDFKVTYGVAKPELDTENLIIYGNQETDGRQAAADLRGRGYHNVKVLREGFRNWKANSHTVHPLEEPFGHTVDFKDLQSHLLKRDVTLIDVRPSVFRMEDGWIVNSNSVPISELHDSMFLNKEQFVQKYGFKKPNFPNGHIVVYSDNVHQTEVAYNILSDLGFLTVSTYDGFNDWSLNGGEIIESNHGEMEEITFHELDMLMTSGEMPVLIDVRPPIMTYAEGQITFSHNVPLEVLKKSFELPDVDFAATFDFPKPTPETKNMVVYGRDEMMAQQAALILNDLGYSNFKVFKDGFLAFKKNGGSYTLEKQLDVKMVDIEELVAGIEQENIVLIDVRPTSWRLKKGWIPSSHSIPMPELEMSFRLPTTDFREKFGFNKPVPFDENVIIYSCGRFQAMQAAYKLIKMGFYFVKVYDGGFFDWIGHDGQIVRMNELGLFVLEYDDFNDQLSKDKVIAIDVRPTAEKYSLGQIPKTVNIPVDIIEEVFNLSEEDFHGALGIAKPRLDSNNVVLYDNNNTLLNEAGEKFIKLGYKNIRVYPGGYFDWDVNGGDLYFPEEPLVVDMDYFAFKDGLDNNRITLIDVSPLSYRQESGWIPDSYSIPVSSLSRVLRLNGDEFLREAGFQKPLIVQQSLVIYSAKSWLTDYAVPQFRELGYKFVRIYVNGFEDWKQNGGRIVDKTDIEDLNFEELVELLLREDVVLLDTRNSSRKYLEGQISGSSSLPSNLILNVIPKVLDFPDTEFEATFGLPKPPSNKPIVVYSSDEYSTIQAARELTEIGYSNVRTFSKGLQNWKDNQGEMFVPTMLRFGRISFSDLENIVETQSQVVIDVRPKIFRYRIGWIPTSHSIPFSELEDGFFLEAKDFLNKFHFKKPSVYDAIVVYSMAGVQAQRAAELLHGLGYTAVRIFPNFQEWATNNGSVVELNEDVALITFDGLEEARGSSDVLIVDVRDENDLYSNGRIKGSANIPIEMLTDVIPEVLVLPEREFFATFGISKPDNSNNAMVVYGKNDFQAYQGAAALLSLGYHNVGIYEKGFDNWVQHGGQPENVTFVQYNIVDFPYMQSVVKEGETTVIDVRPTMFRESQGWIPGSHSIPLSDIRVAFSLNPEEFLTVYEFPKPSQLESKIIIYCTAGLQAQRAANILFDLGYKAVIIYPGFREWLRNGGDVVLPNKKINVLSFDMFEEGRITEQAVVVDIRNRNERFSEGEIPGSKNISEEMILQVLPSVLGLLEDDYEAIFGIPKPGPGKRAIFVYGKNDFDAYQGAEALLQVGYTNVGVYAKGFRNWQQQGGDPVIPEVIELEYLLYDIVKSAVKLNNAILVDVRPEALRASQGWIPGSHSIPIGNLDDALSLPAEEFHGIFRFEKPDPEKSKIIVYCAASLGAARGAVIFLENGYKNVRVYSEFQDWVNHGGDVVKPLKDVTVLRFNVLREFLKRDDTIVVDVRDAEEKFKVGQILGSVNIPVKQISAVLQKSMHLPNADFKATFGIPKPNTDNEVIAVYANNDLEAYQGVSALLKLGYQSVMIYDKGFATWKSLGGEVEVPVKVDVELVEFQDLQNPKDDEKLILVDVRPIEMRLEDGWIPGSISIPLSQLQSAMKLESRDFLLQYEFEKPSQSNRDVVLYASSFIQTEQAAAIYSRLGYPYVKVYAGGFKDWRENNGMIVHSYNLLTIKFEELRLGINTGHFTVIDVRDYPIKFRDGKVPGSYNVPLADMRELFDLPLVDFLAIFGQPKPDLETAMLVVYGRNDYEAREGSNILSGLGYNVRVYDRGLDSWKLHRAPIEFPELIEVESANFDFVRSNMIDRSAVVVDVRPRVIRERKGWIPGSYNLPLISLEKVFTSDEGDFLRTVGFKKPPLNRPVIVYSGLDLQSRVGATALKKVGYEQVTYYEGGFEDWQEHGGNCVKSASFDNVVFRDVLLSIEDRRYILVDTRPLDVHYTEGRIPGSISVPTNMVHLMFTLPDDEFIATFNIDKPPLSANNLVLYDSNDYGSWKAAEELKNLGYKNIKVYYGGFQNWQDNRGAVALPKDPDYIVHVTDLTRSSPSAVLLDVRPLELRLKDGWIPESQNIPVSHLTTAFSMDSDSFKEVYGFEKPDEQKIFYSTFGLQSDKSADILTEMGVDNVMSYSGGYQKWLESGNEPTRVTVDYDDVKPEIELRSVILVDVRETTEVQKSGIILRGYNIPGKNLGEAFEMPDADFAAMFGFKKPPLKSDRLVLYGSSNNMAVYRAAATLWKLGFHSLRIYSGGVADWLKKGEVLQQVEEEEFMEVGFPVVSAGTAAQNIILIDMRPRENANRDGWIPYSYNIPVSELEYAFMLPPEEFQSQYRFPKPDKSAENIIVYSGMESHRGASVLRKLGYRHVNVYTPGFSDWIRSGGKVETDRLA